LNLILLSVNDTIAHGRVVLSDRRGEHIVSVLRSNIGDKVRVGMLQGNMGWGRVLDINGTGVELELELDESPPAPAPVTLILALPRPKVLKRLLVMLTTLGVKHLVLVNSWRVDKSYWNSPVLEEEHLRNYLCLGLEQARDTILPTVELKRLFKPFVEDELDNLCGARERLLAHPGGAGSWPHAGAGEHVLFIGPEGGLIPYEVSMLEECGFKTFSMGARILHVETAVAACLARLGL
jgi:RsmE family RNA methyltransferase